MRDEVQSFAIDLLRASFILPCGKMSGFDYLSQMRQKATPYAVGIGGGFLEQMTGIEPAFSAWEADALPLSYICKVALSKLHHYTTKKQTCQVVLRKNFAIPADV